MEERENDKARVPPVWQLLDEARIVELVESRFMTGRLDAVPLRHDIPLNPSQAQTKRVSDYVDISGYRIPRITQEFWTSGQRQASSLHEVSYRACFKPQLPRYFIKRLTVSGDVVYDPFSGRGTSGIEAALMGRRVIANDVNPLSRILAEPRLFAPSRREVERRLGEIPYEEGLKAEMDLSMFYHPDTETEIVSLRKYLLERRESGQEDQLDRWIRLVATNRLTGHSAGFFSVYTFPPNQAVSADSQRRINERRKQKPEYRDTKKIILKKTASLLSSVSASDMQNLHQAADSAIFITCDARETDAIPAGSVQLTVTSPPFLDIVKYADDNWLRCWFNAIDVEAVARFITMAKTIRDWAQVMGAVLSELYRITRPGGWVAFEVGELRNGEVRLEEHVIPLGLAAGFDCQAVLVNSQAFTKTSNIWGISNNKVGTNTNRIVLFAKGGSGR